VIRAVIFDLGNTLITSDSWFRVELHTLASETLAELTRQGHLFPLPVDELAERADRLYEEIHTRYRTEPREITATEALAEITTRLGLELNSVTVDDALEIVYRACVPSVKTREGAHETLVRLRNAGYRLAVLSNARYGPFVPWALEAVELTPHLEAVVSSADVGWRKPSVQVFQLLLERLGVSAHESVYVGDYYPYDIVGAKAAGMHTVWLRAPYSPVGEDADVTIDELAEVVSVLERWRREEARA
jgi:HAD superfamily hydrolase (TIGR01662 family)